MTSRLRASWAAALAMLLLAAACERSVKVTFKVRDSDGGASTMTSTRTGTHR